MPVDDAAPARSGSSRPFPVLLPGAALVLLVLRVGATWWESRSSHAGGDLVHWVAFEMSEALAAARTGRCSTTSRPTGARPARR